MKYNIFATGSQCNVALATFSTGEKVLFDFGKGALKACTKAGYDVKETDYIFISHAHTDHIGDCEKVSFIRNRNNGIIVNTSFELIHNVPNNGFASINTASKEAFFYLTDFSVIPDNSIIKIIELLQFLNYKSYKVIMIIELSYCLHLYNKLDEELQYGLDNHCSDENFFKYAKMFQKICPTINFITTHASQRGEWIIGDGKGYNGTVCPVDYVKIQLNNRLGYGARFGEALGFAQTYNFINV